MTLQDNEVLALFEQEAGERLAALSSLLLELEADGATDDRVARLFREAHTLKGAANVVGLAAVAAEAHALEDLFDDVRTGRLPVTPDVVDQMLASVDRLIDLSGLDRHVGASDDGPPADRPVPHDSPAGDDGALDAPETVAADPADGPDPVHAPAERQRETARVAVERLDHIVRLAGEATAAHVRLAQLVRDELHIDPYAVPELREINRVLSDLQEASLRARMLPLGAAGPALQRLVRDVCRRTGKDVEFDFRGRDTELDRAVHERLVDALLHIVRNALDHGVEPPDERVAAGKPARGTVVVHAMQLGSRVVVTVTDDGRGVDREAVRAAARDRGLDTTSLDDTAMLELLFHPGLSTAGAVTDVSGRGVGLDAVRDSLAELRGRVEVESTPGAGTTFRISVPITLTVLRALVVRVGDQRYGLPMSNVLTILAHGAAVESVQGRPAVRVDRSVVGVSALHRMLGSDGGGEGPVVVITGIARTHAFAVDEVEGERDVLLKQLPTPVPSSDLVVGVSAEPDGTAMLVLDAETLVEQGSSHRHAVRVATDHDPPAVAAPTERILVVDDAVTVRELQRMILERAGYAVTTACDGRAALEVIDDAAPDLMLTDVEMPRLDGLELVRAVRRHSRWANVPVVVLTSRGEDEDRRAALDAGADAYIVKSSFDEAALLGVVERLLGVSA